MSQLDMLKREEQKDRKALAVIPARKGSRRVPRKNVRLLGDKPLVCWTFEAAKQAETLDRVIVSTDDPEVKKYAEQYGVEVPFFPRPAEISTDCDTTLVLKHAIEYLENNEGYKPFYIVTLQPTSPFRTAQDINDCVRAIKNFRDVNNMSYDTVLTVSRVQQHPYWTFRWCPRGRGRMVPFLNVELTGEKLVSQNLPELWFPTGGVYVNTRDLIVKYERMFGWNIYGVSVPRERALDIDDEFDFKLAECMIRLRGEK